MKMPGKATILTSRSAWSRAPPHLLRSGLGLIRSAAVDSFSELRIARRVRWKLELVSQCDYGKEELDAHRATLARAASLDAPIRTVNWYVCNFEYAYYGGVHTLLRFAAGWRARHGVVSRFLVYDAPRADRRALSLRIADAFPELAGSEVIPLGRGEAAPPSDLAVATHWPSAYFVLKDRAAARKLYFIQDFEPLFYPAGTEYALAEATYRLGLPAIVNTPGLADIYRAKYGGVAFSFVPAVDGRVFRPPEWRGDRPFRVFLYGRPRNERNAFELGLAAVAEFAQKRGTEVDVVVAGDRPPRGLCQRYPRLRFLGRLPYAETGELYRTCHAGLALMLTPHPSYLPFELMASGAVPIATVNRACRWLLRDGENALVTEPSRAALAGALERLMDDEPLRQRLSAAAVRTVSQFEWDGQIDAAVSFARRPVHDAG